MLDWLRTAQSLQPNFRGDDVVRIGRDATAAKLFGEFSLKFWRLVCEHVVDQLLRQVGGRNVVAAPSDGGSDSGDMLHTER